MALRHSRMLPLGTRAPDFTLPDATGRQHALGDFAAAPALLVMFICNHCPFVRHVLPGLLAFAREYQPKGLAIVAISANDAQAYPADAPPEMARLAAELGFTFPYLFDESQAVAKAFEAICTPEFYLFDRERRLAYRGRFDDSRPGSEAPVTGRDLRAAAEAVLNGKPVIADQEPSAGCSIKWRAGQEPGWA